MKEPTEAQGVGDWKELLEGRFGQISLEVAELSCSFNWECSKSLINMGKKTKVQTKIEREIQGWWEQMERCLDDWTEEELQEREERIGVLQVAFMEKAATEGGRLELLGLVQALQIEKGEGRGLTMAQVGSWWRERSWGTEQSRAKKGDTLQQGAT